MHFSFSAGFGAFYSVSGQLAPWIKKGQGTLFGLAVWDLFHLVLIPAMGTVPYAKNQPLEEHTSEMLGHMVWMWTIDRLIAAEK